MAPGRSHPASGLQREGPAGAFRSDKIVWVVSQKRGGSCKILNLKVLFQKIQGVPTRNCAGGRLRNAQS